MNTLQGTAIQQSLYDQGLRNFMIGIYNNMMVGLVISGLTAFIISSNMELMSFLFNTPMKWVVMLSPLAFIFVLSYGIEKFHTNTSRMLFYLFSGIMGISLSSIFIVFTAASITQVFFITASMFAATSIYGYTTKRDLTTMGSFMFMGLIGILIASLVNLFLASSAMAFAISVIGVIVFVGLTAWDTQNLKETYLTPGAFTSAEEMTKIQLHGSLSLYLNFVNLFNMLLQLLGQREE
jgi:uncharacterized protein